MIAIVEMKLPEIRNAIIVPMVSVTYYTIKIKQYLEGDSTKQKHVGSSSPLYDRFYTTILKENRSEFIEA